MTAPTKATMIKARVLVTAIPTSPASQPPRNAPKIPTTMSQMSPSPCPVMTFPARKPAIAPTMMNTIKSISDETSYLPRGHHLTAPVATKTAQGTFPPETKLAPHPDKGCARSAGAAAGLARRDRHSGRVDVVLLVLGVDRAAPTRRDAPTAEIRDPGRVARPHRRVTELRRDLERPRQPALRDRERAHVERVAGSVGV